MGNDAVAWARAEVEKALNNLRGRVFVEDAELTFIMRLPKYDECEMIVTNDDLDELAKVIERRKKGVKLSG